MRSLKLMVVVLLLGTQQAFAGNIKYPFYNKSNQTIEVMMDNRETHIIPPGGGVVFEKANAFDNPSFTVFASANGIRGKKLAADSFHSVRFMGLFPPKPSVGGRSLYFDSTLHD